MPIVAVVVELLVIELACVVEFVMIELAIDPAADVGACSIAASATALAEGDAGITVCADAMAVAGIITVCCC